MTPLDAELTPITEPREAVEAWERIYSDHDDSVESDELCRRLAVGLVASDAVRAAVGGGPAADLPRVRGFVAQLSRLTERVRITPLSYMVEFDAAAASFVARHPDVIAVLLKEQGELGEDAPGEGLTHRLRENLTSFLRKMKAVAPLLLNRVEMGRAQTEKFLQFLHRQDILEPLRMAPSVRDALGPMLTAFAQEHNLPPPRLPITRTVVDNILWQVAFAVVQQHTPSMEAGRLLDDVRRLAEGQSISLTAETRYRLAFAEVERQHPALTRELLERVNEEYQLLI